MCSKKYSVKTGRGTPGVDKYSASAIEAHSCCGSGNGAKEQYGPLWHHVVLDKGHERNLDWGEAF